MIRVICYDPADREVWRGQWHEGLGTIVIDVEQIGRTYADVVRVEVSLVSDSEPSATGPTAHR